MGKRYRPLNLEVIEADAERELANLKRAALAGENIFGALMSAARVCSLYQMTQALYEAEGWTRQEDFYVYDLGLDTEPRA